MTPARLLLALAGLALIPLFEATSADQPLSEAEQKLFLDAHLGNVQVPATLHYRYTKSGSLEPVLVQDEVSVALAGSALAKQAHVDYLTGPRALSLPDIQSATANPVILFFLERDVREMQRLGGGQAAYYRKRVRLALAEAAQLRPVMVQFEGRPVEAVEISVRPYDQDPLQGRFSAYADKTYAFTLSPEIPGMVYEMRTTMFDRKAKAAGLDPVPALIEEVLTFSGTQR